MTDEEFVESLSHRQLAHLQGWINDTFVEESELTPLEVAVKSRLDNMDKAVDKIISEMNWQAGATL